MIRWARSRSGVARDVALLSCGALSAAVVWLQHHADRVFVVGSASSGVLALITGGIVVMRARRDDHRLRVALRLCGVSILMWAAGQLALSGAVLVGRSPADVNQFGWLTSTLAIAGFMVILRSAAPGGQWLRLGLDAALTAVCAALLLWRVLYLEPLGRGGFDVGEVTAVGLGVLPMVMAALLFVAGLSTADRLLLVIAGTVSLAIVADQLALWSTVTGQPWPWQTSLVQCLMWPIMGISLLRFRGARIVSGDDHQAESRVTMVVLVANQVMLAAVVASFGVRSELDEVTLVLTAILIVTYGAREGWSGWWRGRLLRSLTTQALTDPLTELGNRRALIRDLTAAVDTRGGSVLTLDLDGFKEVNDLLGHSVGDRLLIAVARQLTRVRPSDSSCYRVGGDEFVVVVPGPANRGERVAERVLDAVRHAGDAIPATRAVAVSASVGVASWQANQRDVPDDPLDLLVRSGAALRAAKGAGRDRTESYDGSVAAKHRRDALVERRLRVALMSARSPAAAGLRVAYQPIVDVRTGRICALEALARWSDVELGRVWPDEFVPVAERTGLISALGRYVVDRALEDLCELDAAGVPGLPSDLRVSVNVSAVQLRSTTFTDDLLSSLRRAGVSASRLVVEVTESIFMDEGDIGIRHLALLRNHGVQVSIDDFGRGYSSLAYLSRLPATGLKLDQTLLSRVVGDARSLSVLRAIVDLAHSLPLDVVVEGIETGPMHEVVRGLTGCLGQGWHYSAAVPINRIPRVAAELQDRIGGGLLSPRQAAFDQADRDNALGERRSVRRDGAGRVVTGRG
ncbi:MAG: putative bifunctional diguanylate cyclase/phosphodiesterase [Angustibacter sp.]